MHELPTDSWLRHCAYWPKRCQVFCTAWRFNQPTDASRQLMPTAGLPRRVRYTMPTHNKAVKHVEVHRQDLEHSLLARQHKRPAKCSSAALLPLCLPDQVGHLLLSHLLHALPHHRLLILLQLLHVCHLLGRDTVNIR